MFADIVMPHEDGDRCYMRQPTFIPGEHDEASISYCDNYNKTTVRATICCEDTSDLNQDLKKATQWAHGKVVGGRTKVDMVVEWTQCQILGRSEFMGHPFTKSKLVSWAEG
ncbi:hypothetical protein Hanom_Chr07g00616301 [Helianthus anomalus]